jgi:hypothetical protein
MSTLEQTKLIELIKGEIDKLEYRFEGYKKELYLTLVDILVLERGHLTNKTNIDKKVADKVDALGSFIKLNSRAQ